MDKWSLFVMYNLGYYTTLRFNELKKSIEGISSKVLSERLKRMERDGYLSRTVYPEVPIRVEYQLTDFGINYMYLIISLTEWIAKNAPDIVKRRIQFDALAATKEAVMSEQ